MNYLKCFKNSAQPLVLFATQNTRGDRFFCFFLARVYVTAINTILAFAILVTHAPCFAEDIEVLPELESVHLCKMRQIELEQLKRNELDKKQEIADTAAYIAAQLQADTLSGDFAHIAQKCLAVSSSDQSDNKNCTKELFAELLKNREGLLEQAGELLPAKHQELKAIVAKKEEVAKNINDFLRKRSLELPFDHGQVHQK
jgi:hypothetical protein